MSVRNLDYLLTPRSVALVGASATEGSLGAVALRRLTSSGFRGAIGLVNPKYRNIGDSPCHRRIADLPVPPDLGVIVTPPHTVPGVVSDLASAGARAAVIITAGLDAGLKQKMLDAAKPHCLRILGPNCLGLQVPGLGLDASFAHLMPRRGNLALLSQSGAIVAAMIDWAEAQGIGFSLTASMGDMADVDVGDLLDRLATDRETRAILLYLEHVTHGRKFMSAARAAARVKPVIAVKAGRSAAAAQAAASHTGALAGSDAVYDAALRRAGILRVGDLDELFDAAEALARHRPLLSDRLAILTNGGGAGVLAADAAAREGVRLAALSDTTFARLNAVLPQTWSGANPVDIIGDASGERYQAALEALLEDPGADAVLVMNCPTGLASSTEAAEAVVAVEQGRVGSFRPKPVLTAWLGEATASGGAEILSQAGLPSYPTPARAVAGFAYLARHCALQTQLMRTPPALPEGFEPDRQAALDVINHALAAGRSLLTEPEAKAVLAAYGIPTVETRIAANAAEAGQAASDLLQRTGHKAIAIKILSRDISHKSDVGGVRLNLTSAEEVREAAAAMLAHVVAQAPGARIDGVVVQPMIHRPGAHELILGLGEDQVFGPVVLFGAGGTSVEVVADKALALPPLDLPLVEDMIGRTRIARLLGGYRDRPAADMDAIALALVRLSHLSADLPAIRELDINPLLADQDGVIALDARIVVREAAEAAPGANPRFAIRPYPTTWDQTVETGSGTLRIRPIRPADESLYPDFLSRLTGEDIRLRFFGTFSNPSHSQVAHFTQIDYSRAMAFVALDPETGELLGVSRLSADPDNRSAEFAVLVRSDRHGEGIGRALMQQLIDYARAERIGELEGDILNENTTMRRLSRALGFTETDHPEDRTLQRAHLKTGPT